MLKKPTHKHLLPMQVDAVDKYGTTALIWACRGGRADIAESLLRAGASVDTVGMYSWTPLLVATRYSCRASFPSAHGT